MRWRLGAALPAIVASAWLATLPALAAINYPSSSGILKGTSTSIGGTTIAAGTCATAVTVSIPGATVGMAVAITPNAYPGAGIIWQAYVTTGGGSVTVVVCADVLATPTATTYNVRVIP